MLKIFLGFLSFITIIVALMLGSFNKNPFSSTQGVTVYISQDQVFSEPIIHAFEKETGIKVNAIYDTEESKSTGVMNRLIAEKNNPQADVYWANEPIRAEVLKIKSISAPYHSKNCEDIPALFKDPKGYWCGFSARARVFIVNDKAKNEPSTIFDYTNPSYKGKLIIANPLFGTTTAQISALFSLLGDKKAKEFMKELKDNEVKLSTSNGESADFVAAEQFEFSLVDSDDVINRMREGKKVHLVYPDQKEDEIGVFIVPNATVLIKNAPHPQEAKILIDYLLSAQTQEALALAACAQIPLRKGLKAPKELKSIDKIKIMPVNYADVASTMIKIQSYLKEWTGL